MIFINFLQKGTLGEVVMGRKIATGRCPECGSEVVGCKDDDMVCFCAWCDNCQRTLLEYEIEWC